MSKKLVVISIDAMGAADLTGDLSHLPALKQIKEKGSHIKYVTPVYPSVTYPSHATIITGVYPNKHGIVNNTMIQPSRKSPDWYWYKKDIQVPTLFDVAKKEGLSTAAFLWPTTAKSKITYHIAEIFPNRIWTNQVLVAVRASSPLFLLRMNQKYKHLRQGVKQPYLDDFVTACAMHVLRKKRRSSDLTMIHLTDLDSMRHKFGVFSEEAKQAMKRQDERVQKIIDATKEAGTFEETTFVVLGDHYQMDVKWMIRLNVIFESEGWLNARADGTVRKNWKVYAKTCDGATYIYCKKGYEKLKNKVQNLISELEGVESIYTAKEAEEFGADSACLFMVEGKKDYFFIDEAKGEITQSVNAKEIGNPDRYLAVHGYSPVKENYETTMMVMGEGIKKGFEVEKANMTDEAPTLAKILSLETFPSEIDGEVIKEIFE